MGRKVVVLQQTRFVLCYALGGSCSVNAGETSDEQGDQEDVTFVVGIEI